MLSGQYKSIMYHVRNIREIEVAQCGRLAAQYAMAGVGWQRSSYLALNAAYSAIL